MDFVRKSRNITYHSPACKMYLRHDFKHRCAYCQVGEADLSRHSFIAEEYFEKDHFLPQTSGDPEVHKYTNLFYACRKCNHNKDDVLLRLNPCEDDVFGGLKPQIVIGDAKNPFVAHARTDAGKDYIEKLQLNSRYHIRVREIRASRQSMEQEWQEILRELKDALPDRVFDRIMILLDTIHYESDVDDLCGNSKMGQDFSEAQRFFRDRGVPCCFVFEEDELDIMVKVGDVDYLCEMRIGDRMQSCYFNIDKLRKWRERQVACGVCQYIKSKSKMMFAPIAFDEVDWKKKRHVLKFSEFKLSGEI